MEGIGGAKGDRTPDLMTASRKSDLESLFCRDLGLIIDRLGKLAHNYHTRRKELS